MTWISEAMFKLKNDKFSEFSDTGDLRLYSLQEVSSLIKNMKREERIEGQINIVTWSNEHYVFEIEYDLHGKFRKILSEDWLNPKMDIITRLRKTFK